MTLINTTPVTITNQVATPVSLQQLNTAGSSLTNAQTTSTPVALLTFRVLWSEQNQMWAETTKQWREFIDTTPVTNL